MRTLSILLNLEIVLSTLIGSYMRLRPRNGRTTAERASAFFRFFTTLSNELAAFAALLILAASLAAPGAVPRGIFLLKYASTAAVTVTFLTVLFFLGPLFGYRNLMKGSEFFFHLVNPLCAVLSFCFCERFYPLTVPEMLLGLLPTVLYGAVYFRQVVLLGEEKGGWPDFYGFNRGGHWKLSMALMFLGTLLICAVLRLLFCL